MKTGRPTTKAEVKSALQMSGVYGRVYETSRITLSPITMWLKFKDEQDKQQSK
jgi:hypothetical protein